MELGKVMARWIKAILHSLQAFKFNVIDQHFVAVNSLSEFQREALTCTPQA
jgi:ATP adenylyltransferase/5',5'''-P-1,P-4-tetraphosphate phosphorylase II